MLITPLMESTLVELLTGLVIGLLGGMKSALRSQLLVSFLFFGCRFMQNYKACQDRVTLYVQLFFYITIDWDIFIGKIFHLLIIFA